MNLLGRLTQNRIQSLFAQSSLSLQSILFCSIRIDDATCVDSGVEMNGDTASNRTSYSSTIDVIDLKAIANGSHDTTDSNLKDHNTSSSETISPEKPKKKTGTATKKPAATATKKRVATEKGTPTKSASAVKSKPPTSAGKSSTEKSSTRISTTSSKTAANGVFDRLSGSTKSRSTVVSRAASRESVASQEESKPKRSSINGRPTVNKAGSPKVTQRKVIRKAAAPDEPGTAGSSKVTLRRTASASNKAPAASRPRSQRNSLNAKSTDTTSAAESEKGSFLKKMLAAKAAAVKASS